MSMESYEGGCLCGKVRFRVSAPMLDSGYCHCRMCQRNSGSPVIAFATFPVEAFGWIRGAPAVYASSANARRQFCAGCGSYMVFQRDDLPQEISVNVGAFDDPTAFPPRSHIFSESRVSWLHIDDDLPRLQGYGVK
jgi:hypothetical protein